MQTSAFFSGRSLLWGEWECGPLSSYAHQELEAPECETAAGATVRGSAVYDVRYDDGDFAQLDPSRLAKLPPA